MTAGPAIIAERLVKSFGAVLALDHLDLRVDTGAVVGLLGPNGAGKTTTVRILATLLRPDGGLARVAGLDVVRHAARVRRLIGLSGQYAAVDGYLTARENLTMIGRLAGLRRTSARARADELIQSFELTQVADRTARTYSGGTRRRLDVAASLVARPRVLFLDEPTTGLDPRSRRELWTHLTDLAAQGGSALLTTQHTEEAERICDRLVVMDAGRVIASGTAGELKSLVGGDRLELHAPPGADPQVLAAALAGLGSGPPSVDGGDGRVVLPVANGPGILPDVAGRLDATGLRIADLALRRPSLDDVLLALTGEPAVPTGGGC